MYTTNVRQLGILTDDIFNCNTHTNNIVSKFKRSNSILSKLRYYVNKEIMGTIYFAIFHSYLTYVTIVLGQIRILKKRITVLHKSALSIMIFKTLNSHSSSYFQNTSILKFYDLVKNCSNSNSFSLFAESFKLISESHSDKTRSSNKSLLLLSYNTSRFGRKLVICFATLIWNHLKSKYSNHDFIKLAPKALKNILTQKLTLYFKNSNSAYFVIVPTTKKWCGILDLCSIYAKRIRFTYTILLFHFFIFTLVFFFILFSFLLVFLSLLCLF